MTIISHYEGKNYRWALTDGVEPNYALVTNLILREGRFITESDNQQRRNVLVVGVNAADALFPEQRRRNCRQNCADERHDLGNYRRR
ncbi:MAG: ABC transporter permease [Pyrinomonadaceae bacterium]